jgi:hypothetical protein
VYETGLCAVGATLAARFRLFPTIVLTNAPDPLSRGIQEWFTFPDTELAWDRQHLGVGDLHFPYGLEDEVEPDFPL